MTTQNDLRLRSKLYYYAASVTSVYDGDTFTADIDVGLGIWRRKQPIRLWKLNTPEVSGAERARGLEVRDFVAGLILNKSILLRTILDKRGSDRNEKFGRLLGEVLLPGQADEVINLNELLIERGMAVQLDERGTTVRSVERPSGGPEALPAAIYCPYCGEARTVDGATGWVAQCPNCLDQPYRWRDGS